MTIKNLKDLCKILNITWEEFANLDWWIEEDYIEEYGQIIIRLEICTEDWAYRLKTTSIATYWEKTR